MSPEQHWKLKLGPLFSYLGIGSPLWQSPMVENPSTGECRAALIGSMLLEHEANFLYPIAWPKFFMPSAKARRRIKEAATRRRRSR